MEEKSTGESAPVLGATSDPRQDEGESIVPTGWSAKVCEYGSEDDAYLSNILNDPTTLVKWCIELKLSICHNCNSFLNFDIGRGENNAVFCSSCAFDESLASRCRKDKLIILKLHKWYQGISGFWYVDKLSWKMNFFSALHCAWKESCFEAGRLKISVIGGLRREVLVEMGRKWGIQEGDISIIGGVEMGDRKKLFITELHENATRYDIKRVIERNVSPGSIVISSTVCCPQLKGIQLSKGMMLPPNQFVWNLAENLIKRALFEEERCFEKFLKTVGHKMVFLYGEFLKRMRKT